MGHGKPGISRQQSLISAEVDKSKHFMHYSAGMENSERHGKGHGKSRNFKSFKEYEPCLQRCTLDKISLIFGY